MRIKYPRTPHLPWSPGATDDDIHQQNLKQFEGKEVVVTEKMDGENTTIYRDYTHARSIDSRFHPSRTWVKALQAQIGYQIPEGWRICGENLYARHSIAYEQLPSYFLAFSIWNERNRCLSWHETELFAQQLGLELPKVLYRGVWCEKTIRDIVVDTEKQEGYVVRTTEGFHYDDFKSCVAKWLRTEHVTTDKHWMHAQVIANGLSNKGDDNEEA